MIKILIMTMSLYTSNLILNTFIVTPLMMCTYLILFTHISIISFIIINYYSVLSLLFYSKDFIFSKNYLGEFSEFILFLVLIILIINLISNQLIQLKFLNLFIMVYQMILIIINSSSN
jgi:hypothetical protein